MLSRFLVLLGAGACLVGCGSSDDGGGSGGAGSGPESIYVTPSALDQLSEATFYDHPWPSDQRLEPDGTARFDGFPNPRLQPLIRDFIDSMRGVLHGFSPAASGFLRFTAPLDAATLPADPNAALDADSSVQLVDVDPASPEHSQRRRISLFFRKDAGVYWPENTLSFIPTFGFPLRPATRYALVVTDAVKGEGGAKVRPSADLAAQIKAGAASPIGAALAELATVGVAPETIVHLAAFTTNDPTAEAIQIRDWVRKNYPAPSATAAKWTHNVNDSRAGLMDVYYGEYGPSPDFQKGSIPFQHYGDGGALAFDANGVPQKQRDFDLRFLLSVPDATVCPMPANGYPIVVYAHGTGGDYRSALGLDDESESLAKRCIALMGIDQIFHGARPGGLCGVAQPPCNTNQDLIFFNVANPTTARANGPESAIDVVQQARLFTESHMTVPASVSATSAEIKFDASSLTFFGHSQGGLNGPLFLAIDDQARGGVLSGSGSLISITLLEKTKPVNIAGLVKTLIGVSNLEEQSSEDINSFHPAISFAQSIVDTTDPIHYVPLIALHPRDGFAPKSVLMTEGVNADGSGDNYAPPHAIEVQSVAMGLPPQAPLIHPIAEHQWDAVTPITIAPAGLSGNLAGGQASGVLAQWEAAKASDGHFVIYDIPAAMSQCTGFVRALIDDPKGKVPAP